MKNVFIYNKDETRTFLFPNGDIASPAIMKEKYPAITIGIPQLIEAVGATIMAVQDFAAMREIYEIDPALDEAAALAAISEKVNAPQPEPEASPEEITAAAAVVTALNTMPDDPQA